MISDTLADLARALGGRFTAPEPDRSRPGPPPTSPVTGASPVTGPVVIDSREARPGSLFVALAGDRTDGHRHVADALARGAVAVLAERPVPAPAVVVPDTRRALIGLAARHRSRLAARTVIGITGSAGKTTTKDLLAHVLAPHGPTVANRLSFNNTLGLPLTLLSAGPDTRHLVLEMGGRRPGEIAHLADTALPTIGVVTNTGTAHLGPFGGREGIRRAKSELIRALPPEGTAVLNADDPAILVLRGRAPGAILTFGTRNADVLVEDLRLDEEARPRFTLRHDGRAERVALGLHGPHQALNAAAATAAALAAGLELPEIAHALRTARRATPSRMQLTRLANGAIVLNDAFTANPHAMDVALHTLAALAAAGRRPIAVLGEMRDLGAGSADFHRRLGRRAAALGAARLIGVGGPEAALMVTSARRSGLDAGHAADPDRALALLGAPRPHDVVLVKGSRAGGVEHVARALSAPPV
ncbi:UDP-N-acetylmuramoyl-tripeptide--D-alanyl-D-alanine ligase [Streptomyces sp. BI20]|uniref:UDP-N-acetylmuramoyl-tripeptide--D-alanyl-D- alanine ligase n=1 Tax=Streptomyces sp. BI20 TaxID=3403460 RepID=UPI003C7281F8